MSKEILITKTQNIMPNHVTNVLTVIGDESKRKAALLALLDNDNKVNFNKSLPIPKELEGTTSPSRIISDSEYKEQEEKISRGVEVFAKGITKSISKELIDKFGYDNWYDWQLANWGTKWNAYDQKVLGENLFQFDTAWASPITFFENISKKFPEVTFKVKYADEDMGYNVGEYHIKNGEYVFSDIPEGGSLEAYRLAISLQGGDDCWMLNDFLVEEIDEDTLKDAINGGDSFETTAINLAYEFEKTNEDYPEILKQYLLDMAIEDENYDYAAKLRDSLKKEVEE